jgi:histone acetyltransferase
MEYKLDGNQYDDLSDFINDVKLIVANCKQYNGEKASNTYTNAANKLEKALENSLKKRTRDQEK